jgi:hypothetical protein
MSETKRRTCGTSDQHRDLLEDDPSYRKSRLEIESMTTQYVRLSSRTGLRSAELRQIVRIPVVVHVVYNTPEQNISDAQIHSQIDILSRDFRKLNADANLVPSVFKPLAADTRVEFQLAVRDPNGNPTTGITRTSTNITSFKRDNRANGLQVKSNASGGKDSWQSEKYLNLWVCNLAPLQVGQDLLGYAQFPADLSTRAKTDGVVINYKYFSDSGTATPPFDKGRTVTHEVGHWLDLYHIWGATEGADEGSCFGSDNVADTPNQAKANEGSPSFPHISCNNGPNGDMFMNYMDYTYDAAMFMFTAGQSRRIDATLNGPRASLLNSDGLIQPFMTSVMAMRPQDKLEEEGDGATLYFNGVENVPISPSKEMVSS